MIVWRRNVPISSHSSTANMQGNLVFYAQVREFIFLFWVQIGNFALASVTVLANKHFLFRFQPPHRTRTRKPCRPCIPLNLLKHRKSGCVTAAVRTKRTSRSSVSKLLTLPLPPRRVQISNKRQCCIRHHLYLLHHHHYQTHRHIMHHHRHHHHRHCTLEVLSS